MMTVGYVFQGLGFLCGAIGLWQTWKQHAGWREALAGIRRRLSPSSSEPVSASLQGVFPGLVARFEAQSAEPVDVDAPLDQQLVQLRSALARETESRMRASREVTEQVEREAQQRTRALVEKAETTDSELASLTNAIRGAALEGLPLPVVGWLTAAIGFLLQVLAAST